jgi:hypothetical protein
MTCTVANKIMLNKTPNKTMYIFYLQNLKHNITRCSQKGLSNTKPYQLLNNLRGGFFGLGYFLCNLFNTASFAAP